MTIGVTANNFGAGGTSGSISSGALTTAQNDYLFASIHFDNHTAGVNTTVTGITDSLGNTWTKLASSASSQSGQFQSTELWGAVNTHAGTSVTVTAATSGARDGSSMYIGSFNGVDTNYPIAVPFTFVTNYTSSSVALTPSGTLNSDGAAVITGYQTNDNAAPGTLVSTTGWTAEFGGSSGSSLQKTYYKLTNRSSIAAQWNAGDRGAAYIGALRASGAFATGLDGSATNSTSAGTTCSATLTTTKANDEVVAVVYNRSNKASPVTCSSITGTNGLTWTRRSINTVVSADTSDEFTIEVFYAAAASALAAKTIVANMSASCDVGLIAFGVSGANTTTPWDASGSFNNKNPNSAPQTLTRLSPNLLSTTNADDFVFAMCVNDVSNAMSVGSIAGFVANALGTVTTTTSSLMQFGAEYLTVATPLSSKDAIFQAGNSSHWLVVSDAIVAAPVTTAQDGSATAKGAAVTSLTAALTTAQANDIIVATVMTASDKTHTAPSVTSVTSTGLTFTKRSSNTSVETDAGGRNTIEVWWAVAASPLSAANITANFAASADAATLVVFGVSGVNTTNPWDSSANLPKVSSAPSSTTASVASGSFSTTSPNDFIFAAYTNDGASVAPSNFRTPTIGSPAASFFVSSSQAGTFTTNIGVGGASVGSQQSAANAYFDNGNNSSHWLMVTDALTASTPSITNATGTISTALTKPALALVGKETFKGTINTALSKVNLAATGTSRFVGTITMNLSRVQMALAGKETFSGSIATHLQGISQHLTAPGNSTGTISMTLPKTLLAAAGEERFIGTINTALRGFNVAQGGIVAREIFVGSIHTNLSGFVQIAGVAEERFVGTIRTRLGTANTLVTTDVKGLLIILGDIYTNLYPPDLTLLGAKIGAPGQGQWYSYRYLDSGSS